MRIWQAGKKQEILRIWDPLEGASGGFVTIGGETRQVQNWQRTGLYTGAVTLVDGKMFKYEFDGFKRT